MELTKKRAAEDLEEIWAKCVRQEASAGPGFHPTCAWEWEALNQDQIVDLSKQLDMGNFDDKINVQYRTINFKKALVHYTHFPILIPQSEKKG